MSVVKGPGGIASGALRVPTVGLIGAVSVIAFEAMAVATAMPTAARALHGLGAYGWVFTGFLAATVLGMVGAGRIGDLRGPRAPLLSGMALFAAGLVIAGLAPDMAALIGGRVVRGLGSGLVLTEAYVVIGTVYPERLRPRMLSALASAWVLPSLLGPLVAGAAAQHWTWRAVFLGLVPFVVAAGSLFLPSNAVWETPAALDVEPPAPSPAMGAPAGERSGLAGGALARRAVAAALGVAGLAQAGENLGPVSLTIGALGAIALGWGLRGLLPPGTLLARRGVGAAVAFRGLMAGAFTGVESVVPLLLTLQHGWSATVAGLPLTATALTWAGASWWLGRHGDGPLVGVLRVGFALLVAGVLGVAWLASASTPPWTAFVIWPVAGLGAGLVVPSAAILLLAATNDADRGRDAAALQLSDSCLGALGTGIAGALVAAAAAGTISYRAAFACTALGLSLAALAGALLAGRGRPAGAVR